MKPSDSEKTKEQKSLGDTNNNTQSEANLDTNREIIEDGDKTINMVSTLSGSPPIPGTAVNSKVDNDSVTQIA